MRKPAGLLALILLTLSFIPQPAWSLPSLTFQSGFAAETDISGAINPCPAAAVTYGRPANPFRETGGEGVASTQDSNAITNAAGSQATAAAADAVRGALHGVVSAAVSGACSSANSEFVAAGGIALAQIYDTYTVVLSILAPGTPVSVSLDWTLKGSFSSLGPADSATLRIALVTTLPSPPFSSFPASAGDLCVQEPFDSAHVLGVLNLSYSPDFP